MAITEGAVIVVNGADASSDTYTSSTFDSSGGGGILYFIAHEGASTTYTWSDNKSTSGANFVSLGTAVAASGPGTDDMNIAAMFVHGPTVGTGHTITCTLGAARPYRYGGGVVLNGSFSSTFLAATTQTANGNNSTTVDAGSLVTDAAAYLFHCAANWNANAITVVGSGWTIKSNATAGRHFQVRNEASSGTFDPSFTIDLSVSSWVTIAAAIKETAGGSTTGPHQRLSLLGVG